MILSVFSGLHRSEYLVTWLIRQEAVLFHFLSAHLKVSESLINSCFVIKGQIITLINDVFKCLSQFQRVQQTKIQFYRFYKSYKHTQRHTHVVKTSCFNTNKLSNHLTALKYIYWMPQAWQKCHFIIIYYYFEWAFLVCLIWCLQLSF